MLPQNFIWEIAFLSWRRIPGIGASTRKPDNQRTSLYQSYLLCIAIPQKYSVIQLVGFIKGKSAITVARDVQGRAKNFVGQSFWARGYYVSTVGRDEKIIREYIRNQEAEDRRLDQLNLLK